MDHVSPSKVIAMLLSFCCTVKIVLKKPYKMGVQNGCPKMGVQKWVSKTGCPKMGVQKWVSKMGVQNGCPKSSKKSSKVQKFKVPMPEAINFVDGRRQK
jgi:hypothetical protein